MTELHFRTIIRKDASAMAKAVLLTEENLASVALFANERHFGLVRTELGELVIRRKYENDIAVPGMWVAETGDTFMVVEDIEDWIDYERPGLPLTADFERRRPGTITAFEDANRHPLQELMVVHVTATELGREIHTLYSRDIGYAVRLSEENPRAITDWLFGLSLRNRVYAKTAVNTDGMCVLRVNDDIDLLPGDWLVNIEDKFIRVQNPEAFADQFTQTRAIRCYPSVNRQASTAVWD